MLFSLMEKKGDLAWDTIGKLVIALAFLLLMLVILYLFKDKLIGITDQIKALFRVRY